jgi:hypothetical protein
VSITINTVPGVFPSLKKTRARAETGGADHWVLKRRELPRFARVMKVSSASLGYPLSVFNKNSTLKARETLMRKVRQYNLFACIGRVESTHIGSSWRFL